MASDSSLKGTLKTWEATFKAEHGRMPTYDDIKADPICAAYREYKAAKKIVVTVGPSASAALAAPVAPAAPAPIRMHKLNVPIFGGPQPAQGSLQKWLKRPAIKVAPTFTAQLLGAPPGSAGSSTEPPESMAQGARATPRSPVAHRISIIVANSQAVFPRRVVVTRAPPGGYALEAEADQGVHPALLSNRPPHERAYPSAAVPVTVRELFVSSPPPPARPQCVVASNLEVAGSEPTVSDGSHLELRTLVEPTPERFSVFQFLDEREPDAASRGLPLKMLPAKKPRISRARATTAAGDVDGSIDAGALAKKRVSRVPAKSPTVKAAKASRIGNFVRLNLKRNHRIGGKSKFSKSFKRKNHRNFVASTVCYKCGKSGHWASKCPEQRGKIGDDTAPQTDEWTAAALQVGDAETLAADQAADLRDLPSRLSLTTSNTRGRPTATDTTATPTADTTAPANTAAAQGHLAPSSLNARCVGAAPVRLAGPASTPVNGLVTGAVSVEPPPKRIRRGADVADSERGTLRLPLQRDIDLTDEKLVSVLQKLCRFDSFNPGQLQSVNQILDGHSSLVILPTGSGKSLCYQLPAAILCRRYRTMVLVVSPLLSLMQDQQQQLPAGLRGASINGTLTAVQRERVRNNIREGVVDVLFVAPEQVESPGFLRFMLSPGLPPVAFACIDEVHCVSEWSHNFRPAYLRLCQILRDTLHVRCLLGLTATATQATVSSVVQHLGVAAENVVRVDPIPSNLSLFVELCDDRQADLVYYLKFHHCFSSGSVIVYCNTQNDTVSLAQYLASHSLDADCYHGGMEMSQRKAVQNRFMAGKLRILVATMAFGMGLNKRDVRGVIHYQVPRSMEGYVQEVGRAGRDGLPAFGHVFFDKQDVHKLKRHVFANYLDAATVAAFVAHLAAEASHAREERLRMWDTVETRSPAAAQLVKCARSLATAVVALPVEATTEQFDIKPAVLGTLIACLDQLGPTVRRLATNPCQIRVQLLSPATATGDPLVCALVSQFKHGAKVAVVAIAPICNLLGLSPQDVLDGIFTLQRQGYLIFEYEFMKEQAYWLELSTVDFVANHTSIAHNLFVVARTTERVQLHKIDTTYNALLRVAEVVARTKAANVVPHDVDKRTSPAPTDSPPQARVSSFDVANRLLRAAIQTHFETPFDSAAAAALPGPCAEPLTARMTQLLSADIRELIRTHGDTNQFTPQAVARILQGIPSPRYPFQAWSSQKLWDKHADADFIALVALAEIELARVL